MIELPLQEWACGVLDSASCATLAQDALNSPNPRNPTEQTCFICSQLTAPTLPPSNANAGLVDTPLAFSVHQCWPFMHTSRFPSQASTCVASLRLHVGKPQHINVTRMRESGMCVANEGDAEGAWGLRRESESNDAQNVRRAKMNDARHANHKIRQAPVFRGRGLYSHNVNVQCSGTGALSAPLVWWQRGHAAPLGGSRDPAGSAVQINRDHLTIVLPVLWRVLLCLLLLLCLLRC